MKKVRDKIKALTLIELIIAVTIIIILVLVVVIIIRPGEKMAGGRDATREKHIYHIQQAVYAYYIENNEYPSDNIPYFYNTEGENLREICNTNDYAAEECQAEYLVDLSPLVKKKYMARIPIDPLGGDNSYGSGYYIAEGSIIIVAVKAETKTIAVGISKEEYLAEAEKEKSFSCESLGLSEGEYTIVNEDVVYCGHNDSLWTQTFNNNGEGFDWGCRGKEIGVSAQSSDNGQVNSTTIINFHSDDSNFNNNNYFDFEGNFATIGCHSSNDGMVAAKMCDELNYAGVKGWYLPAWRELREDFGNSACGWIGSAAGQVYCSPSWDPNSNASIYWSSSEFNSSLAWFVHFSSGNAGNYNKFNNFRVRCRFGN